MSSKTPNVFQPSRREFLKSSTATLAAAGGMGMLGNFVAAPAFAQVTLNDTSSNALAAFNHSVKQISAVEQCHMIAGNFDYLLKVRTRNMAEYRQVLGEQISALPHVLQTSTFVVMENVKDAGL